MKSISPEPPGNGSIHLYTNGPVTHIEYDAEVMVLAHLFYCALKEIPYSREAMRMAINKYNRESPDSSTIRFE